MDILYHFIDPLLHIYAMLTVQLTNSPKHVNNLRKHNFVALCILCNRATAIHSRMVVFVLQIYLMSVDSSYILQCKEFIYFEIMHNFLLERQCQQIKLFM